MAGFTPSKDSHLNRKVMTFVDFPEGDLDDAGKGILSEASRLAKYLGTEWVVACLSGVSDQALSQLVPYGVDQVTVLEGPAELPDSLDAQAKTIAAFTAEAGIGILLLPHNDLGGSLAPLLASELQGALFTEAIAYEFQSTALKLTRQSLGFQVAQSKVWDGESLLVLTIHSRILSAVVLPTMRAGQLQVDRWTPQQAIATNVSKIIQRIPPDPQTVDVSEAEVIFSVGLGCNDTTFAQIEELSRLLNASLGVTRPVYDLGYVGFERMVGQTGKTVAPRFYLAMGISGSMHHIGGIKDSKRIVSINSDSKAPIFPNSDEGFVANLNEVLPLLIERVKTVTGGAA